MMRQLWVGCLAVLLGACALGPDYRGAPTIEVGERFSADVEKAWKQSDDMPLLPEKWWLSFQDEHLNQLMDLLHQENLSLAKAMAESQAQASIWLKSKVALFPHVGINGDINKTGGDRQLTTQTYRANTSFQWEIDLWGKIRRDIEANHYSVQISQAEIDHLRLSLQGALLKAYFGLRMTDAKILLLNKVVQSEQKALQMNQYRYEQGVAAKVDVITAQAQLENARVKAIELEANRQQYESTIAVLLGKAPSTFSLASLNFQPTFPIPPIGLPAELLRRRPDIYIAERNVAKANAQIGIAKAAWFPNFSLNMNAGWRETSLQQWLLAPLQFWSLGPALALSLFDGGAKQAELESRYAQYSAQVANYRQTVLNALKEVEDQATLLQTLERQQTVQQRALQASRTSLQMIRYQYQAGLISYLNVMQVEQNAYNTEINALQLMNQRLNATVDLMLALGGGWQRQDKP